MQKKITNIFRDEKEKCVGENPICVLFTLRGADSNPCAPENERATRDGLLFHGMAVRTSNDFATKHNYIIYNMVMHSNKANPNSWF